MFYDSSAYSAGVAAQFWPQAAGLPFSHHEGDASQRFNDSPWQNSWDHYLGNEKSWTAESLQWHTQLSHPSHMHYDAYESMSDSNSLTGNSSLTDVNYLTDVYKMGHHQVIDSNDTYELLDSRCHQTTSTVVESIFGLLLPEEPAEVLVVNSHSSRAYQSLCADARAADLVAFDAEWAPDYAWGSDNPISVLQLAFPVSRCVYVLQLERLGRRLPKDVQMMLVNPEVRKVGFAVDGSDRTKMARSGIAITDCSVTDVQAQCAAALGVDQSAKSLSLKNAARGLLGFNLKKDKRISCSDWSIQDLTPAQIRYAAFDAWVALRLSFHC